MSHVCRKSSSSSSSSSSSRSRSSSTNAPNRKKRGTMFNRRLAAVKFMLNGFPLEPSFHTREQFSPEDPLWRLPKRRPNGIRETEQARCKLWHHSLAQKNFLRTKHVGLIATCRCNMVKIGRRRYDDRT